MTTREMASNSSMQYSNSLINIKNIEQDLAVVHSAQALELNDKALALAKKIVNGEVGSNGIREEYYSALVSYNDALNKRLPNNPNIDTTQGVSEGNSYSPYEQEYQKRFIGKYCCSKKTL